jgi:hypothetical protein
MISNSRSLVVSFPHERIIGRASFDLVSEPPSNPHPVSAPIR